MRSGTPLPCQEQLHRAVSVLRLSMLMEACVLGRGGSCLQEKGCHVRRSPQRRDPNLGFPFGSNVQSHFRRWALPLFAPCRLPTPSSTLSRIITNLNTASQHGWSGSVQQAGGGIPLQPNGTCMFASLPGKKKKKEKRKRGPLWCTPIRENGEIMCSNVQEGR